MCRRGFYEILKAQLIYQKEIISETIGVGSARQWEVSREDEGKGKTLSIKSHPAVPRAVNSCYQAAALLTSFTWAIWFKGPITSSQNVPNMHSGNGLMSKLPKVAHKESTQKKHLHRAEFSLIKRADGIHKQRKGKRKKSLKGARLEVKNVPAAVRGFRIYPSEVRWRTEHSFSKHGVEHVRGAGLRVRHWTPGTQHLWGR